MWQRLVALLLLAESALVAQELVDLRWRETADGRLEFHTGLPPDGQPGAEWVPMFPDLLSVDDLAGDVGHLGVAPLIPLLVHGSGGAAAIDAARHRLDKLGVRMVVADGWFSTAHKPDPLRDLLYVRFLATHSLVTADFALRSFVDDEPSRDRFVRAAAAEAYNRRPIAKRHSFELSEVERPAAVALRGALERMPDDWRAVLGINSANLPSTAPAMTAWRRYVLSLGTQTVLDQGGHVSPAQYAVMHRRINQAGQLPYEIAARLGNWRVDYALFAQRGAFRQQWWFQLGGEFQPQRVHDGLQEAELGEITLDAEVLSGRVGEWQFRLTSQSLEAWQGEIEDVGRGQSVATLHDRAGEGQPPVWAIILPAGENAELPVLANTTLELGFDPRHMSIYAAGTTQTEVDAATLLASWKKWQADAVIDLDSQPPNHPKNTWRDVLEAAPGLAPIHRRTITWRQCIRSVQAELEDRQVRWRCDLAATPLVDVASWLDPAVAGGFWLR
ncbi:MAG: hypothetical protein NXI31_19980 [bacterium]|nr:hypothetical protein [bacterium]